MGRTLSNLLYQWRLRTGLSGDGSPISGATDETYTICGWEAGYQLQVTVGNAEHPSREYLKSEWLPDPPNAKGEGRITAACGNDTALNTAMIADTGRADATGVNDPDVNAPWNQTGREYQGCTSMAGAPLRSRR